MDWVLPVFHLIVAVVYAAVFFSIWCNPSLWRTDDDIQRMLDSVPDVPYLPLPDQQEASTGGEGTGPLSSLPPSSCVICIAEYGRGEGRFLLPGCGHAFHRGCIAKWLRRGQTTCPICRAAAIVVGPPAGEEKVEVFGPPAGEEKVEVFGPPAGEEKVDAVTTVEDMV